MVPKAKIRGSGSWATGRSLQWRHNECDGVWNHRHFDCLLDRLFRPRSKKISKLRVLHLAIFFSFIVFQFFSGKYQDFFCLVKTKIHLRTKRMPPLGANTSECIRFTSWYMMTSSIGNIFRVTGLLCGEFTGEFPTQRPVTRGFDVFFDLHLNKGDTWYL